MICETHKSCYRHSIGIWYDIEGKRSWKGLDKQVGESQFRYTNHGHMRRYFEVAVKKKYREHVGSLQARYHSYDGTHKEKLQRVMGRVPGRRVRTSQEPLWSMIDTQRTLRGTWTTCQVFSKSCTKMYDKLWGHKGHIWAKYILITMG